jgi:fucose permease
VNFINYTQKKFDWGLAQSSSALCLMFSLVALLPKLVLSRLGVQRSITLCSLVYASAFFLLGATNSPHMVYVALVLLAAGATALPATLALLTNQVDEKGAANGAADTCRTLSSMLGFPLGSQLFAYGLRRDLPGLVFYAGSGIILLAYLALQVAITWHSHHDRS